MYHCSRFFTKNVPTIVAGMNTDIDFICLPSGNSQLVKLLLDEGADFTAADDNGATALHYAAQGNFSETVEVFLSFDNIEDIPDKEGRTALMWAAGKGVFYFFLSKA